MSDNTIGRSGVDSWLNQIGSPTSIGGGPIGSLNPAQAASAAGATAASAGVAQVGATGPLDALGPLGLQNSKYVGGPGGTQLSPPTLPRLPTTASTNQESLSFLQESQAAVHSAGQHVATLPGSNTVVPPFNPGTQTVAQTVGQLTKWGANQAEGVPALARSTLGQFLLLRVQSDEAGVKSLQGLASLSNAAQGTLIEQEMAQSRVAEAAAKKAADKAAKMGPLGKVFQAVIAVVSVVLAVCSFGSLAGLAVGLIVAASVAVIAGSVEGKKNGKGFDFFGALDAFSMALSLGTIGVLLKGVATVAIETGLKALVKGAEKVGAGSISRAAEKAAEKVAVWGADDAGKAAAAGGAGAATGGSELGTDAARLAANKVSQRTATGASQAAGEKASEAAAKGGVNTSEQVADDLIAELGKALGMNGKNFGKSLVKAQFGVAALSSTEQVATGAGQLQVTHAQADSKEALAVIGMFKAMVDRDSSVYKTLNDGVQGMIKVHTDVIDDVNRAVHERSQLNQNISSNFNA